MKWLEQIIDNIMLDENASYNSVIDDNLSLVGTMVNLGRSEANAVVQNSQIAMYSAIMDNKTCPLCADLDGQYVKVGSTEYYDYTPPLHGRCRCIWVYIGNESIQPNINFKAPSDDLLKAHGHLAMNKIVRPSEGDKSTNLTIKELEEMVKKAGYNKLESKTINMYSDTKYMEVNKMLREGKQPDSFTRRIDSYFNKAKPLDKSINVYRFSKSNMFGKDILKMEGTTFIDKGFMSTTIRNDMHSSIPNADTYFKIKVPKGTKVLPIDGESRYEHEQEILLNRGTKIKITKVYFNKKEGKIKNPTPYDNKYIVECEVVK